MFLAPQKHQQHYEQHPGEFQSQRKRDSSDGEDVQHAKPHAEAQSQSRQREILSHELRVFERKRERPSNYGG